MLAGPVRDGHAVLEDQEEEQRLERVAMRWQHTGEHDVEPAGK